MNKTVFLLVTHTSCKWIINDLSPRTSDQWTKTINFANHSPFSPDNDILFDKLSDTKKQQLINELIENQSKLETLILAL